MRTSDKTITWCTWLAYAIGIILAFLVLRYARNPLNLCSDICLNADDICDLLRRRDVFKRFSNNRIAWSPFEKVLNITMDYLFCFILVLYSVSDVAVWLFQIMYAFGIWLYCQNFDLMLINVFLRKRRR